MKASRCPTCRKLIEERTKSFPFCSARCKLIDVGKWLDGGYRIAAEPLATGWGDEP